MFKIMIICDDCFKQEDSEKENGLDWIRLNYKEDENHFCSLKCVRNFALKQIQKD